MEHADFTIASFLSQRTRQTEAGEREKLLAMAAGIPDLISLGRGDPDLPTPRHIIEAAKKALDEGYTHYTHWAGVPQLRAAIAEKYRRENGVDATPDEVVVTAGAQEAVYVTFQALLNPGDEVLMADPFYTSYEHAITLAGGRMVPVATFEEDNFVMRPEEIEKRITDRTKILVVVSPGNPTGSVAPPETMRAYAEIVKKHNLLAIHDEIYEKLTFDGVVHVSLASLPGMKERTICINGFSKAYSMTGWRIGYLVAPAPMVKAMEVIKHTLTICAPAVSQAAALAAITGPQDCVAETVAIYAGRRRVLMEALDEMGLPYSFPGGGLYVFASVRPTGLRAFDFCVRILKEARVQIFPGTAYGQGEGYVRISFLAPVEKIREACARMRPVVRAMIAAV